MNHGKLPCGGARPRVRLNARWRPDRQFCSLGWTGAVRQRDWLRRQGRFNVGRGRQSGGRGAPRQGRSVRPSSADSEQRPSSSPRQRRCSTPRGPGTASADRPARSAPARGWSPGSAPASPSRSRGPRPACGSWSPAIDRGGRRARPPPRPASPGAFHPRRLRAADRDAGAGSRPAQRARHLARAAVTGCRGLVAVHRRLRSEREDPETRHTRRSENLPAPSGGADAEDLAPR